MQSQNLLDGVEPGLHMALIMLYASVDVSRSSLCMEFLQLLSPPVALVSQLVPVTRVS